MKEIHNARLKYTVKVAALSAIAFVLMLFEFPLSFVAPSFYELDFSEVAVLIGSFALGPWAGVLIELVKNLLHILIVGTSTAYIGELANFVTGCAFVLPAALLYRYRKGLRSAILSLLVGVVSFVVLGAAFNYFYLIEAFSSFYGMPLEAIIGMGTAINPAVDGLFAFVALTTAPFNLIKGVAVSLVTLLLYKRISPILHR